LAKLAASDKEFYEVNKAKEEESKEEVPQKAQKTSKK